MMMVLTMMMMTMIMITVSDVYSRSEILESLSKVKHFALHHGYSQMINSVMELEDISMKTFLISSKQSQITDFFKA